MNIDRNGTFAIGLLIALGQLIGGTITGGAIAGKKSYDEGKRGWDLFKDIILGGSIGLAVGGVTLMLGSMGLGLVFGVTTKILGITALQVFAIGGIAFNIVASIVSPIFNLDMQGIEFESPNNYDQYQSPTYQTPLTNSVIFKKPNLTNFYKLLNLIRSKDYDRISWISI